VSIVISELNKSHWPDVKSIYEEGIATKNATFETQTPGWDDWDQNHIDQCRFVALSEGKIVGWAALSPISNRCVYGGVAEVSVYVLASASGKGIGTLLLNKLIESSEEIGLWTLQAGIFPENKSSIRLHLKCGFREVGFRERVGQMDGIWRDVILFERRSKKVGI